MSRTAQLARQLVAPVQIWQPPVPDETPAQRVRRIVTTQGDAAETPAQAWTGFVVRLPTQHLRYRFSDIAFPEKGGSALVHDETAAQRVRRMVTQQGEAAETPAQAWTGFVVCAALAIALALGMLAL